MVYVDTMHAGFGKMVMCHCIADSMAELLAMMDRIGVQRKWIQSKGTPKEHFDVSLSKRALAIKAGAIEISQRDLALIIDRRRPTPRYANQIQKETEIEPSLPRQDQVPLL